VVFVTRGISRSCRQAALVTFASALSAIAADAQQAPATFFGGGGKREQCSALQGWTEDMERANARVDLMHVQTQDLPRYAVDSFRDSLFVRYFGVPYASLDAPRKKQVAGRIRSCKLAGWVSYAVLGAFDETDRSSAAIGKLIARKLEQQQIMPTTVLPNPVHNAYALLKQTSLADIYLGSKFGRTALRSNAQFCGASASAVLVFKVGPDYRIMNAPEYWAFVDTEVLPAVHAACGRTTGVAVENYVRGYRLLLSGGKLVYTPGDAWPNDVSLTEEPLSQVFVDPTATPVTRRFSTGSPRLLQQGSQGGSINDVYANDTRLLAEAEVEAVAAAARRAQEAAAYAARTHWTYRIGQGFKVSDWLQNREADARALLNRTNTLTLGLSALQVMAGTASQRDGELSPVEAVSTIDFRNRRETAERVLATLSSTAPVRFSTQAIGGASLKGVMQLIFDGRFPTAGRVIPLPDPKAASLDAMYARLLSGTSSEQSDAAYHRRIFKLYHAAYAGRCRADMTLPWERVQYPGEELIETVGPLDRVVNQQTLVKPAVQDVREVYVPVVKHYHPNKDQTDLGSSPNGESRPSNLVITQELTRFLQTHGCSSRVTRQFEVNLYLLAEGFPPAQEIIGRGEGTR
jgi:hypothetical protein